MQCSAESDGCTACVWCVWGGVAGCHDDATASNAARVLAPASRCPRPPPFRGTSRHRRRCCRRRCRAAAAAPAPPAPALHTARWCSGFCAAAGAAGALSSAGGGVGVGAVQAVRCRQGNAWLVKPKGRSRFPLPQSGGLRAALARIFERKVESSSDGGGGGRGSSGRPAPPPPPLPG